MAFKKLGKVICTLALAGVACAVPMLTGCNTDHPEAKITIEFNGQTYVLEYKMYRNMYPQTVQHFIELADNGFYNDTIIHNYQSSYWYGGGFDYVEDDNLSYSEAVTEGGVELLTYMETASKEEEYSKLTYLTPSVYRDFIDGKYSQPLNTLIGEFSNNQHKIENGALKSSFGALRMYYSNKNDVKNRVYMDKTGSAAGVRGDYKYNCATSLFTIQSGSSTSSDSSYCIFGTLKNTDTLTNLKSDVSKNYTSTSSVTMYIDNYDAFVEKKTNEATYAVTKKPIIVRSVEITKY